MIGASSDGLGVVGQDLLSCGGGDLNRGETGQRGASFTSLGMTLFCGVEMLDWASCFGGSDGVPDVDKLRAVAA